MGIYRVFLNTVYSNIVCHEMPDQLWELKYIDDEISKGATSNLINVIPCCHAFKKHLICWTHVLNSATHHQSPETS